MFGKVTDEGVTVGEFYLLPYLLCLRVEFRKNINYDFLTVAYYYIIIFVYHYSLVCMSCTVFFISYHIYLFLC